MNYNHALATLVIFTMIFLLHWMNSMRIIHLHSTHLRFWKTEMKVRKKPCRIVSIMEITLIRHFIPGMPHPFLSRYAMIVCGPPFDYRGRVV